MGSWGSRGTPRPCSRMPLAREGGMEPMLAHVWYDVWYGSEGHCGAAVQARGHVCGVHEASPSARCVERSSPTA
eukprot:9485011-Pyramimonas_sp.AAC.1